jgi:hypothetical protein
MMKEDLKSYLHVFALPWCCVLPVTLSLFGLAGGALGAFLLQLTPTFLTLSVVLIGYSNYRVWILKHGPSQTRVWVALITLFAILTWLWSIIFVMKWITF